VSKQVGHVQDKRGLGQQAKRGLKALTVQWCQLLTKAHLA
jgi:hypothetical protein